MKKERPDIETFAAGIADKEDNPTIHELAKEFPGKTYRELEIYREKDRQQEAGVCVIGEARKDREEPSWFPDGITFQEKYEKEHKLCQEAQGALANALEINESHQKLNGKLQERVTELEKDNKKLAHQIEDRVNKMRKSGL